MHHESRLGVAEEVRDVVHEGAAWLLKHGQTDDSVEEHGFGPRGQQREGVAEELRADTELRRHSRVQRGQPVAECGDLVGIGFPRLDAQCLVHS
ncbi:hypothetical protein ACQEV4_17940 [Streptomyces shenzhenensis]|uniref:hypothetical protein n=1 Tax=Streptomyces shenzhenensis TaxID=943815 RepID=UPI003D92AF09